MGRLTCGETAPLLLATGLAAEAGVPAWGGRGRGTGRRQPDSSPGQNTLRSILKFASLPLAPCPESHEGHCLASYIV